MPKFSCVPVKDAFDVEKRKFADRYMVMRNNLRLTIPVDEFRCIIVEKEILFVFAHQQENILEGKTKFASDS